MARIAVFELESWERPALDALAEAHELVTHEGPLNDRTVELAQGAEVVSVFINSRLTAELLGKLPDLRLVATRSTGTDHIDLTTAAGRGISVCNVPSYGETTVAEHVFALLLAISHRMIDAVDRTRRGDFTTRGLTGFDLFGKTIGVIGTGAIGHAVIRIARGFGMRVLAHDRQEDVGAAQALDFSYVALDTLLSESDIVTLHVPGTAETRHMIGETAFAQMKEGAVLINTARGDVVDVHALLHALATGRLAAAGLDVLPEEPTIREEAELLRSVFERRHNLETLLSDHILLRLRNVVITPHSAFNTHEAVGRILEVTRRNIAGFLEGRSENLVGGKS